MKTITAAILVAALALGSGCARPDWIERTLVTVDVTGVWSGVMARGVPTSFDITIDLKQEGPKVTGFLKWTGFSYSGIYEDLPGPVEGTVSGDRFEFKRINGSFSGAMTVTGDEYDGAGAHECRTRLNLSTTRRFIRSPEFAEAVIT
jgi:hypothetical protein